MYIHAWEAAIAHGNQWIQGARCHSSRNDMLMLNYKDPYHSVVRECDILICSTQPCMRLVGAHPSEL